VAAFIEIGGAYDNVFIDVLCGVMPKKKLPVGLFRFLRNLLWCKTLVFYVGGVESLTLTGYKGLPQGSVQSPLLYICLDLVWIDSSHRDVIFSNMRISLSVSFSMIGLTITATKSEVVLFSRKHLQPVVSIRVNGRLLPQAVSFKYLGVFYDTGLKWGAQAKYVQKRCLQRLNLLKSIAGVWWGAQPRCMLLLHKGLIGSVLDYASVCYSGMAKTHMLRLERVQYRGIRLALGLMCSTPNNSLEVLSGRCIQGYSSVLSMDITPSTSFVISVSRIMSGHSSVRSHLDRFRIVEDPMCVCLKDYESVDHLIWHCERFGSERHRIIDALAELNVLHGTPVRDLCGLRNWSAIKY
jgi:hypothetical protein